MFQPVTGPQHELYLSLERPGPLKKSRINLGTSWKNIMFANMDIKKTKNTTNSGSLKDSVFLLYILYKNEYLIFISYFVEMRIEK